MARVSPTEAHAWLREALTGDAGASLVLLGNFEVEDQWAQGEPGLPSVALAGSRAVVNRMDEFGLLLGGPRDHVVLKQPPDEAYLDYLDGLGLALPNVLGAARQDPQRSVTQDALADGGLVTTLGGLGRSGARLWPHGVGELEEELAQRSGIALAAPGATVCKKVNSKIYSRLVAGAAGLRQAEGRVCRDLAELAQAFGWARGLLAAGVRVVVKDAFGVSGKGLLVVQSPARLDQLERMITRRASRSGQDRLALVVERWLDKRTDLNYQFTVDRAGAVRFDFVKEAITESGSHRGHRLPVDLRDDQHDQIRQAVAALGARLHADGYFGVVGVDALVTTGGELYPVVEINARNNMSTYQMLLQERFFDGDQAVIARQYPLRLAAPVAFARLRGLLQDLLLVRGGGYGVLLNSFATLNAAAGPSQDGRPVAFDGRCYAIVVASTPERARAMDVELARRLDTLSQPTDPMWTRKEQS